MKSIEKGVKVEVCFSLVRTLGVVDKRFDRESGFQPNKKSDWLKILRVLSIRKRVYCTSVELFEEDDWFEQTKKWILKLYCSYLILNVWDIVVI